MIKEPKANNSQLTTILFVDDEEKNCKYFKRFFEEDFNILIAYNVTDTLKLVKENHQILSAIISDQNMPDGKGTDMLKEIKDKYPKIKRILSTTLSYNMSLEEINKEIELFAYMAKPWDLKEFADILSKINN